MEWRAVCVARYLLAQDARHSAGGRIWVFVPVCAAGHWAFAAAEYLSRAGCRWVSATHKLQHHSAVQHLYWCRPLTVWWQVHGSRAWPVLRAGVVCHPDSWGAQNSKNSMWPSQVRGWTAQAVLAVAGPRKCPSLHAAVALLPRNDGGNPLHPPAPSSTAASSQQQHCSQQHQQPAALHPVAAVLLAAAALHLAAAALPAAALIGGRSFALECGKCFVIDPAARQTPCTQ